MLWYNFHAGTGKAFHRCENANESLSSPNEKKLSYILQTENNKMPLSLNETHEIMLYISKVTTIDL